MAIKTKTVLERLRAEFPDEVIGKVKKKIRGKLKQFSNVAPVHYISRLIEEADGCYDILTSLPVFSPSGKSVSGKVAVVVYDGDNQYTFEGVGSEPLEKDSSPEEEAFAVKSAFSDALKIALGKVGVGASLYLQPIEDAEEDEEPPAKPAGRTRRAAQQDFDEESGDEEEEAPPARGASHPVSTPAKDDWESKREKFTLPFSKEHKGKPYSQVPDGFVEWWFGKNPKRTDDNKNVFDCFTKEQAYREANDISVKDAPRKGGSSRPNVRRRLDDDDDSDQV